MSDMDCEACPSTSPLQVVIPESKEMTLTITEKAKNILFGVMGDDSESALLVDVLSGGCSGYKYDLQIIEPLDGTSHFGLVIEGIQVFVPKTASSLLDGVEIDYEDKLMGGGFKLNNPNASKSCGCGESFR
ncbi:MAG: iron-sulfur cluster assembly accessory protein [Euryarchaeota archaeon]|mgnify:CR=1 FL=1|nr:iron-sulfur cluster assembly accessory protein [Euryarchaeota archaeon]|tara:strand:- start:21 stop:413 length:393 start_codon:yes stop_codon:yes gene_type:complete